MFGIRKIFFPYFSVFFRVLVILSTSKSQPNSLPIKGPLRLGNPDDMYGGGRRGQKRMAEEYSAAEADDDTEGRENRAKAELRSVIGKQFKLRKGGAKEEEKKGDEERAVLFAKVLICRYFFQ